MVRHFIGVYKINTCKYYMAAWRYEISLLVLKNISLVHDFSTLKRDFVSPRAHILIKLHDSALSRTHHGGFQRQLLFLIALWVMTAFSEGTQYITLLLPIREIQTTTVQKHKQQPKLQIRSVNRFSVSHRSPQNNWR